MKRLIALTVCFIILLGMFPTTAYALPTEQADAIQRLLDDAVRISGTPGISVAVISDNQTHFFNSGYTHRGNRNADTLVNENTLYYIGSVSKSFTALGILLLEEQGLLSITDRIEQHLPWFYVLYQNEVVAVTIQQLLNHASGLTDANHQDAPRGEGPDMLRRTVEPLVGARLDFAPGTQYIYGNANYNVLGLIIEAVTGQSYESFMTEHVFIPLGLHDTFLYRSEALATGRMAQGHRRAFFRTFTYTVPIYGGMKPTGFIISSAYDMARWMGIHLGLIHDIPEIFLPAIERTQQADIYGQSMGAGLYYSAGWIIRMYNPLLNHAGQTPNFTSELLLLPAEEQGILFLANCISVNFDLVWWIASILGGDLQQSYSRSERHILDIMHSAFFLIAFIATVIELIFSIRNRIKEKPQITKGKLIWTGLFSITAIIMAFRLFRIPSSMGAWSWTFAFDWGAPSTIALTFIMPLFFAVTAWSYYTKNPKETK